MRRVVITDKMKTRIRPIEDYDEKEIALNLENIATNNFQKLTIPLRVLKTYDENAWDRCITLSSNELARRKGTRK